MAQHKIGNRYLDDEEYELEAISMWGFWLFIIGAIIGGAYMRDIMPAEWPKEIRYAVMTGSAISVGGFLAYLSPYIRTLFYVALGLSAISGALYYAWTIV
ncbi:MAG: hypothetical protein GC137_10530 [Alphaproteobacteria bacterium]|nr:hypothetical protein [Alphaproteobacteria bacterium]